MKIQVIDLYNDWLDNEFENVLNTADEIAEAKWQQGYTDGYDTGYIMIKE